MGRAIVILLAVFASMWVVSFYVPIGSIAFVARGFQVSWAMLLFPCLCYLGHIMTGK